MADDKSKDDELAGTEQPFVQHLFELRDRLIKAMAAIAVATVVLALYPGPAALYDIMAAPLVAHLPKGATLIATSVISPFMVPLKIMLMRKGFEEACQRHRWRGRPGGAHGTHNTSSSHAQQTHTHATARSSMNMDMDMDRCTCM